MGTIRIRIQIQGAVLMAITTGIYYHDLNANSTNARKYRVYFIAGDTADITIDDINNPRQMPHDFIRGCKLSRQFDNDLPVGQELASVLELELNLKSAAFNSPSFSEFKAQVLAQESAQQALAWAHPKDLAEVRFAIPNRWYVGWSDDSWAHHGILWDGFQERVKEYEINSDGIFRINVMDAATTVLRNITIETIGYDIHNTYKGLDAYCADELIYYYVDFGGRRYHISNSSTDWRENKLKYLHVSFNDVFMEKCREYADTLLKLFRRNSESPSTSMFQFRNSPLSNWKFYKQNVANAHDETTLEEFTDMSEIEIICSVYVNTDRETIIGGCLSDTNSEGSWGQDYKNLSNLFKALSENFLCKSYCNYDFGTVNFLFMPVWDYSFWNGTEDPGIIQIGASNIGKDWKITYGTDMEQAVAHVINANDEDLTEISVKNDKLGIDEGSFEIKCILHNNFCNPRHENFTKDQQEDWSDESLSRMPTRTTLTQCLFYYENSMDYETIERRIGKLAEYCKIELRSNSYIACEKIGRAHV